MYLHDQAKKWTDQDLKKLVANNATEYKNLEFKSLAALVPEAKKEISKDVSSFANSAGGVIIYGVKEIKEGPNTRLELEEGINSNDPYNKEWLENIIASNISPRIDGLYINPIKLPNEKYLFAVIIPQSNTAHMAGNNRYYKRHNFKVEPMEDYEVRDVMNRLSIPRLALTFTAPRTIGKEKKFRLQILIRNVGEVFVRHFAVSICIPEDIIKEREFQGGRKTRINSQLYREYIRHSNPNQYIFQGFRTFLDSRFLPPIDAVAAKANTHLNLYWTIYNNMGNPQSGKTALEVIVRGRLKENYERQD